MRSSSPTQQDMPRHDTIENPQPAKQVERLADRLEAPSLDDRTYRVIRLSNQLEALLVHDGDTDKASAALDVNVGNFSDPVDMPGMAHAVEHLLFMGTEKYPQENAYNQYLTAHNGHSNAYTAACSTNYYFEVAALGSLEGSGSRSESESHINKKSPLHGALDRFSQFFIAPLFLPSTLDRELKAVDSENKKNLQSDSWRLNQLSKSLSNPSHPFCHFSTGNLETLRDKPKERGVNVRDEFMKFHEREYSANRMKLVVLGRESLNELESWVLECFSGVRNKDLPKSRWDDVALFSNKELLTQYCAKPVMDSRTLELQFSYFDEDVLHESKPGHYLSHLIGHEGPGSILAYLKAKGWANGLSSGAFNICPGSALFTVQVRLTEDGLKEYKEVVKVIFQYISLLHETPPQQWIVAELQGMAEVDFKFRQKTPASKFTSKLSSIMQKPYPREWLMSGPSLIRKFDPKSLSKATSFLRPDNFRLCIVSQEYPGTWDKNEKWYGTEYTVRRISSDFLDEIKAAGNVTSKERIPDLHLPHKNEFIPSNLEVEKKSIKNPAISPTLIRNDKAARTWFKKDDRFWVPKANVFVTLRNPLAAATPENSIITTLYTELVRDALTEYSYDAELAGLEYDLSGHSGGLDLEVSGYNEKMPVLLEKVLVTMRDLDVREDRFKIVKERVMRGCRNWDFQEPYYQVGQFTTWLNTQKSWINEEQLAELPHLTAKDIRAFFPLLLRQTHVETLVHGNMYKEDALRITQLVETTLNARPLPEAQWHVRRSLLLPENSNYVYTRPLKDPKNVNNVIEYFVAVGDITDRLLRAKVQLFSQMTNEPAFNQLRTKEQLGYIVFTGPRLSATRVGYRVVVQSEKPAEYLEKRIDAFMANFGIALRNMPQAEFEDHKRSLINKRQEKLKNLSQESNRFWNHIGNEFFDFRQVDLDVDAIKSLSQEDMQHFFTRFLQPSSPHRSKISVHLVAQTSPSALANETSSEEKDSLVLRLISQYLNSQGVVVEHEKLQKRFESVRIAEGDQNAVVAAIQIYLTDDANEAPEKTKAILEQGRELLGTILPSLGVEVSKMDDLKDGEALPPNSESIPAKEPTIIDNVHEFKARLEVSAGATPVEDITTFEEIESKL